MIHHDATTPVADLAAARAALEAGCHALAARAPGQPAWQPDGLDAVAGRIIGEAEGQHAWQEDARHLQAWWASDYAGRRHVRVVAGVVGDPPFGWPEPPVEVGEGQPLAWVVFHEHARLFRPAAGPCVVVYLCPFCAVVGTRDEVAWMGTACGPCHDRTASDKLVGIAYLPPVVGLPPVSPYDWMRRWDLYLTPSGGHLLTRARRGHHWYRLGHGDGRVCPPGTQALALSPDGNGIVLSADVVADSVRIWLWDPTTQVERSLYGPLRPTNPVFFEAAFSPDGTSLVVAGGVLSRPEARLWRAGLSSVVRWRLPHDPTCLAVSPRGRFAVFGSASGAMILQLDDSAQPHFLCLETDTMDGPKPLDIEAVAISPAGDSFVGVARGHCGDVVVLWDFHERKARTGTLPPLQLLLLPQPEGIPKAIAAPGGLTYTPDGTALLVWGWSGLVYVLAVPDLRVVGTFAWRRLGAFTFEGAFGGDWFVTAAEDAPLRFTPWRPFVEYARRGVTAAAAAGRPA